MSPVNKVYQDWRNHTSTSVGIKRIVW